MRMKKQLFVALSLCLLGFAHLSFGQSITVLDAITQQRVPGAKIFSLNPKVQRLANTQGLFDLNDFKGCDSVYISYATYQTAGYTYKEIEAMGAVELTDNVLSIREMNASANRWEEKVSKQSSLQVRMNPRQVERLGPQTSADLLEQSGLVFIQKSQFAGGSPQFRGFGTNRVMIVVDGVRMNNAIFRSGNLQNIIALDANALESVDVLFGPGSVHYGSDAIGGVMDFRTKKALYSPDSSKSFVKSTLFSRYSTASNESTSHFDINVGTQKWAFLTTVTYARFGDLKTGKHGPKEYLRPTYQTTINGIDTTLTNDDPRIQRSSGYAQLNGIQKIQFKPNKHWEFQYSLNFSQSTDAPRYDRLILDNDDDGVLDNAEWYYGPQKWMMHRLSILNKAKRSSIYDEMRLTFAYQKFEESRNDRKTGSDLIRRQFEKVNAFSANLDFRKHFRPRVHLFYGLEGVFNLVGSNAYRESIVDNSRTTINPRYPDGSTWQSYCAYSSVRYEVNDQLLLTLGARYSQYHIQASFDTTLFSYPVISTTNSDNSINGSFGINYNPVKRFQLFFNGSTGYRAPNIDDMGKVFDSEPGSVVVPNVDLKSEYAYNAEFGFAKWFKKGAYFGATIYYTYLNNALARSNYLFNGQDSIMYEGELSEVLAIQNVSNAYVYGVQGWMEIPFGKGFKFSSTISYQKGYDYNVDSAAYFPKNHITPLFGRTSIHFEKKRFNVELYALYHGSMSIDDFPLNERGDHVYAVDANGNSYTPAWYTINFKGSYFFNKHISVNAGVENITNQLYRTFGSGISAAGRNFSISVRATF